MTAAIDWRLVWSIGIPALVVVAGWFLAHRLTAVRELATRRREARVKALETAYLRIATTMNRPLDSAGFATLELFVAEIQLYGTPKQIELMREIVEGFKKPNFNVSYDAILVDLRDKIRNELALEPVQGSVWWLRFSTPQQISDELRT